MASVMATGSEVLGRCVGEIDVSVKIENRDAWLCCGGVFEIYFGVKAAQYLRCGGGR